MKMMTTIILKIVSSDWEHQLNSYIAIYWYVVFVLPILMHPDPSKAPDKADAGQIHSVPLYKVVYVAQNTSPYTCTPCHLIPFFIEPSPHKREVLTSLQRTLPWCTITPFASRGVNQKPSLHKSDSSATLRHTPVWLRYSKGKYVKWWITKRCKQKHNTWKQFKHLKHGNKTQ